jgi:hypothetical protein
MVGVWPSGISAMDMAWDDNDSIQDFQVTLQYQWWEARTTDRTTSDQESTTGA